jgi:hypothetical protein
MPCERKDLMLVEYWVSVSAYSYAVSELKRHKNTANENERNDIQRPVADTRKMSRLAWNELNDHIAEHGC